MPPGVIFEVALRGESFFAVVDVALEGFFARVTPNVRL